MKKIDFSIYECDARKYGGSEDKRNIYMDGKYYMIKLPDMASTANSFQTSISNNVVSEYIGCHIMQTVGLPAQNTILGFWKDQIAVACEDFCGEKEELHEFYWYMQTVIPRSQIGKIATYEQLYKTFDECSFLQKIKESGLERFWDIIVVDALIGNFDRHKENFGFIVNHETKTIRNAPIYDCGSSLYPALAEEKFNQILSDRKEIEQRVYRFPKIALQKSKTDKNKFDYFDLLSSNIDANCTRAFFNIYSKINMNKVFKVVDDTPYITEGRKNFYKQMMLYRKELILDKSYENLIKKEKIIKNRAYYFGRCASPTTLTKDKTIIT